MRRTLQEWADFLNRYVIMNYDGSVYATVSKPYLATAQGPNLREPLKCSCTYWDWLDNEKIIHIDSEGVDYSEFTVVTLGDFFPSYYYIGWDTSLKSPNT